MKEKAIFSWSGGKDSALALHEFKKREDYEIIVLLTTITEDYDRTSMHGIRRILLEQQANSLSIPLEKVFIRKNTSHSVYKSKMKEVLIKYLALGVSGVIFGDIFLEDVKKYREDNLSKIGMNSIFPIWKRDTAWLANEFIDLGFKAAITCVDTRYLNNTCAGREFDNVFLSELPADIDPCGENGEFHSFVYEGPIFQKSIPHTIGNVILRDNRFYYCDVMAIQESLEVHS